MAGENGRSQMREYTVVKPTVDGFEVVELKVQARNQEHACDLTVEELPVAERSGLFGAFLAGSYREFTYTSRETVVTTKVASLPTLSAAPPEPRFAPVDG